MQATIYLAGGCFWCTEAVFKNIKGVVEVLPGYMGGTIKNPGYREICTGRTGHAEVVSVLYDSEKISLAELLIIFFNTHDPTTLNRQGYDEGTQYRSAIFYTEEVQKKTAQEVMKKLLEEAVFEDTIVTELTSAPVFYPAEEEHINYYANNTEQRYCSLVINPKIQKLKKDYYNYLSV